MSLYAAVCLSAFLAALLVYRYDLYNREPWYLLALAAGLGFGAMRLTASVELWALGLVSTPAAEAAIAAAAEEVVRLAVVAAIAVAFPRDFDDPMDGLIYGSIAGLGMAVEESLHLLVLLPPELVRLLGHLVMGGIAGFGVGVGRLKVPGWRRAFLLSFGAALALHFSWDWVSLRTDGSALSPRWTAFAVGILLSGIAIYGSLVVLGSRLSRARFSPSSARSLWGFPFKRE
jgi:RsiW-degrading membrane proteinase PrsW (M82 family)